MDAKTKSDPPVAYPSPVVGNLRHSWGCALPTRGGMCDCGAIWLRPVVDYLALCSRLAEGHYEQDQPEGK